MNIPVLVRAMAALVWLCLVVTPAAAAPPDAGQLLREQQPQRQLPHQFPQLEAEKERAPLVDSGIKVMVKGVRFSGFEGLATENELQALVADVIGSELGFQQLQALAARVTAYLKDKGWFLARAYLPGQAITSGIIEIAVIQGRSDGSLQIKPAENVRISTRRLYDMTAAAVAAGAALHEKQLERSILLMNDLPGLSARASLAAGSTPGTTAVQVDVSEGPLFSGAVWSDNHGNRHTGTWRGTGMLNVNDPLRYGDQLSLLLTGAEGLNQGRAAYSFPLFSDGLKGTIAYTGMGYELIGDLASLKAGGYSHSVDSAISYPWLRSRVANIQSSLGYQFKIFADDADGTKVRDKRIHSGTAAISGDYYDRFMGGGYSAWNAGVTVGTLQVGIEDVSITGTEGTYTHFNLGVSRLQRLAERLSINFSWSTQLSLDNLDSSEKFNLGGPHGVRAYTVGEGVGDSGHLFNVDLRYDLPLPSRFGLVQLNGFYDAGQTTMHHSPWQNSVVTASGKNSYWLQGAGAGVSYVFGRQLNIRGNWARTIGDNPGRSTSGKGADGRSDADRFWLQAMILF